MPSTEITFQSQYDNTQLEALINLPFNYELNNDLKIVVLLHPYGPLGGNMYDPLINHLAQQLNTCGYLTIRPNLRSRTSWTGYAECQDLRHLIKSIFLKENGILEPFVNTVINNTNCTHFLLLGYSYGSIIASSFNSDKFKQIFFEINGEQPTIVPQFYLTLISYPWGYLWALTLFSSNLFNQYLSEAIDLSNKKEMKMFLLFGNQDQFTSITQYKAWIAKLFLDVKENDRDGNVIYHIKENADHFWRDQLNADWVGDKLIFWINQK